MSSVMGGTAEGVDDCAPHVGRDVIVQATAVRVTQLNCRLPDVPCLGKVVRSGSHGFALGDTAALRNPGTKGTPYGVFSLWVVK
jgi:hypothetical protein